MQPELSQLAICCIKCWVHSAWEQIPDMMLLPNIFFNPVGCVAVKCANTTSNQSLQPSIGSTICQNQKSLFHHCKQKTSDFLTHFLQISVLYSVVYLFFCRLNKWNWLRMQDTAREEIPRSNSAAVLNPLSQKAWLSMQPKSQEYHHHPIGPKCSCSIWEVSPSKLVTSSLVQYQMVPAEAGGTRSVIATIILLVIYSDWCLSQHEPPPPRGVQRIIK